MIDIKAIKERLASLVSTDWTYEMRDGDKSNCYITATVGNIQKAIIAHYITEHNAKLIANAPTDIAALLEALESQIKITQEFHDDCGYETGPPKCERWQAKAEALERALIDHQGVSRCRAYCKNADTYYCEVNGWLCKNIDRAFNHKTQSYPARCENWQFDQVRFGEKSHLGGGDYAMVHGIKILPPYFEEVRKGDKPFELRKNDRNYKVGDMVRLREWHPPPAATEGNECGYTGRVLTAEISYVLDGDITPDMGLAKGYCIFGMQTIIDCKNAGKTLDGMCIGYQAGAADDEPHTRCIGCPHNQFYKSGSMVLT